MEKSQVSNQSPEIKLDKKSKILFAVIGLLVVGSIAVTFWRYMVKRDYIIESQTDCDPETENCFIWECDPDSLEEGEQCIGVPEEDIWYYKLVRRNAKNIPLCDPNDENCDALTCPEGEEECEEVLCAPENVGDGEMCSDPKQYLLENPPEEEECEEGDEKCLSEEECEEGDEECLAEIECEEGDIECEAEVEEACAPDDEECDAETEEECEEDDEECQSQAKEEEGAEGADSGATDENAEEESPQKESIPTGIEPM